MLDESDYRLQGDRAETRMSRRTEQREAIVDALRASDRAVTAQELHGQLEGVGLATVYRNLQRLADAGDADTLRRKNGELAFLLCGGGHHHHLSCRLCGRVERVRDCRLDDWASEVAQSHGFSQVEHHAELVGVCSECARK
jgi:Fur family transcriptional regulator, ferric uptake regulator